MARRVVIIGGGAAGIGAAGAAKATDPPAEVVVYTEFEDVGYSPCGIPYVHGKEIPDHDLSPYPAFLALHDGDRDVDGCAAVCAGRAVG